MDLKTAFYLSENDKVRTFDKDDELPALPLPNLDDSLTKYYENLLPFGNENELKNSKMLIEDFKCGVGKKLHMMLGDLAKTEKNWVSKFWEKYAYGMTRTPLLPYCSMCQPLIMAGVNVEESKENSLKSMASTLRSNIELWNILRLEKYKPAQVNGKYLSSDLWKRFYSTCRIPGETFDQVVCHFKTAREGNTSPYIVVGIDGKLFALNSLDSQGNVVSTLSLYHALHYIRARAEFGGKSAKIPILTCDERSGWAKNRDHLINISENNRNIIKIIEESHTFLTLDSNEPKDYSESCEMTMTGDFHSKWVDKSSILLQFRNGKFGCIGEHSCYDGTLSISYDVFLQMRALEIPEPDWDAPLENPIHVKELVFDIDDYIESEVKRMEGDCERRRKDVKVLWNQFTGFGKEYLKSIKLHPDAFIQIALQLTYYKLHHEYAPTYETGLLRFFYRGRTETVRPCTKEVTEWVLAMEKNSNVCDKEKLKLLKRAINKQNFLMNEAREGRGFDRHLFALWCLGFENGIETHPIFSDPLFLKSGGGGNFILSTSLLGYTPNNGCVAPMVDDGYGVFYSITNDIIYTLVSTYNKSNKVCCYKFTEELHKTLIEMKNLIDTNQLDLSKL